MSKDSVTFGRGDSRVFRCLKSSSICFLLISVFDFTPGRTKHSRLVKSFLDFEDKTRRDRREQIPDSFLFLEKG